MLAGNHFFVNSSRRNLLRLVTQQLAWFFAAKLGSG
jgi:surfactin synthase thioesterase subunit